jgi:hypothetical protein
MEGQVDVGQKEALAPAEGEIAEADHEADYRRGAHRPTTREAMRMDFATRYDFLKTVIARFDGYYNLAAVKGSLLLTSNAIFLAPAVGQRSELLAKLSAGGMQGFLISAAALLSFASMAFAGLVVASWMGRRPDSLLFSDSVAASAPGDYAAAIDGLDEQRALSDLARLAHLLAVGITRKFRYINLALATLVLAVACAFAALAA